MTQASPHFLQIDVGIFAHNEQNNIRNIIIDISNQNIFEDQNLNLDVHILANGCTDDTVNLAKNAISSLPDHLKKHFHVHDMSLGGKSRTWNIFVHTISRRAADFLIMLDCDIRIRQNNVFLGLIEPFKNNANLRVTSSRPVKSIASSDRNLNPIERAILSGGGTFNNWRTSICGQLYTIRAEAARQVWMPVGLPVEDGFLRAMVLTDCLSRAEDLSRIDGDDAVFHEYESEATVRGLVRHQTRIVVGSAVNAMLFAVIRRDAPSLPAAQTLLENAALDDSWLARVEKRELPRWPFGYVPLHFLTKRLSNIFRGGLPRRPAAVASLIAGFTLDATAYVLATAQMGRSGGSGHW